MTSASETAQPIPAIREPASLSSSVHYNREAQASISASSSPDCSSVTISEDETMSAARIPRPKIGSRKSSGTMIVSRESATTVVDSDLDENDVRTMSPRRNSEELEQLSEEARRDLVEQAKVLQTSLQAIVDRVEAVKSEHEKLEGGNKFLQSYIGELMQTSKITSTAPSKSKGKARSGK